MFTSLAFGLISLLSLSHAQNASTTVPLFLFGGEGSATIVASVITAGPSMTAYHINCPTQGSSDCGWGPGANLTVSDKSVWDLTLTDGAEFSMSAHCTLFTNNSAVCTETAAGREANFPGTSTEVIEASLQPVIVTAGVEKLASATATASSTSKSGSGTTTGTAPGSSSSKAGASIASSALSALSLLSVAVVVFA